MMHKTCLHCGKGFEAKMSRTKYCGSDCGHASQRFTPEQIEHSLWSRLNRNAPGGCWLFPKVDRLGYGHFTSHAPLTKAHRAAWIFTHGPIPDGLDVCHKCDVRNCCNPEHLWLGTEVENCGDARAKKRTVWGDKNMHATLTNDQVREIRKAFVRTSRRHSNTNELAAKYGVKRGVIYSAVTRRSWEHLD